MPHIHGVAWIEQLCLNGLGFKNGFLCEGTESKITELADELISCEIPEFVEETPSMTVEEKKEVKHQQKLRKTVLEVELQKTQTFSTPSWRASWSKNP